MNVRHIACVTGLLALCAAQAGAVCETRFLPTAGVAGVNGTVSVLMPWDPDGPGPSPESLVAGGDFSLAGNVAAAGIACWHPGARQWSALGAGVDGWVHAITPTDGKLYVGGYLNAGVEGTNGLACWDPATQTWTAVGGGPATALQDRPPSVTAMAVLDGDLYVASYFKTAGGVTATNIGRWDPQTSTWSSLGLGLTGTVHAMAVLNGKLYLGGEFSLISDPQISRVACWDPQGSAWSSLGSGVGGVEYPCVWDLLEWGGKLYVAGDFSQAGEVPVNHLAAWNPQTQDWAAIGTATAPIAALATDGTKLYAMAAAQAGIYCRDASAANWGPMAEPPTGGTAYSDLDLAVLDGKLYVGSDFTAAGGVEAVGIACWDLAASGWSALGSGTEGAVLAMAALNGKLYVGGGFQTIRGLPADRVASWNPDALSWAALGSGVQGGQVQAMVAMGDGLFVGGTFETAGGSLVNHIARWDGVASWSSLDEGVGGSLADVAALAVHDGNLYVAGSFRNAGRLTTNNVAGWDTNSGSWFPLGAGTDERVNALAVLNGKLYAGGHFRSADGTAALAVAAWDPASQHWSPLGAGLSLAGVNTVPSVTALAAMGNRLYAAGRFTQAGGVNAKNVACWDPATLTWSPLGAGVEGDVHALAAFDGLLYVAGWLGTAGGLDAASIAAWDPAAQNWLPVIGGADERISALAVLGDTLYGSGHFTWLGGAVAAYWGRLYPELPALPADLDRDCEIGPGDLEIFIACASGPAVLYADDIQVPGCTLVPDAHGLLAADFDADHDVDQADFATLQRYWTTGTQ